MFHTDIDHEQTNAKFFLNMRLQIVVLFFFILGLPSTTSAQGFTLEDWNLHLVADDFPAFRTPYFNSFDKGLSISPIDQGVYFNSKHAWGPNGGNVWQGKGISSSTSMGIRYSRRFFDIQVHPIHVFAQNREFRENVELSGRDGYEFFTYYDRRINYRERISPTTISKLFWGNSWARLNIGPISAGLSTENINWGPGRRNPLLLNSNAPGFEHFTLHTNRPVNLYFGKIQSHLIVGRLNSSFNENDHLPSGQVHFSGVNLALSPWFSDNLHVGLIRSFIVNEQDLNGFDDYVPFFQSFLKYRFQNENNVRGNDRHDQRASVYFSWHFPQNRFSIYGEYARDDHSADLRDVLLEPNHTRAFMVGFEKSFNGYSNSLWSVNSEVVQTEITSTSHVRGAGLLSFYTHETVRQGYTHYGQLLGTSYGAGSNGWYISAKNKNRWGGYGFIIERIAKNKDLYHRLITVNTNARPELELMLGVHGMYDYELNRVGKLRIKAAFHSIQTKNKFYLPEESEDYLKPKYYNPLNLNFQFGIAYYFSN